MGSKYSKEFRRDALKLCERESVREASEKLGVPIKALYTWRRTERLERGETLKGLHPGETRSKDINDCNARTRNCVKHEPQRFAML